MAKKKSESIITGFKGFDKDLKCRGYQFEVGKEFKEEKARLCNSGFHFCENPFDVFGYYNPSDSRYCTVEAKEVSDETESDSKRCSKTIKLKAEIGLQGIIKAGVDFILEKVNWKDAKESNTGDYSVATNTGNQSAATNIGNQSAATVEGLASVACALGYGSKAKAPKGSAIVVVERDCNYKIINIKAAVIDGEILKENTFYTLIDGEFKEVE